MGPTVDQAPQAERGNNTAVHTRPRRQMKSTQQGDFDYTAFHNRPVEGKKAKENQRKDKQMKMKEHPEAINWDYQLAPVSGREEPCDVQFYTLRPDAWKSECVKFYEEQRKRVSFKKINSGEQLIVEGHVTINFYSTGFTLVQGENFVDWGNHEYPTLLQRLDVTASHNSSAASPAPGGLPTLAADSATQQPNLVAAPQHQSSPSAAPGVKLTLTDGGGAMALTPIRSPMVLRLGASQCESTESSSLMQDILTDSDLSSDDSTEITNIPETAPKTAGTEGAASNPISSPGAVDYPRSRNIDSLLAEATSTPEGVDVLSLQQRLHQREQELEREREELQRLKQDAKLMKRHLSEKDDNIKGLQVENRTCQHELTKSKKELQKVHKQRHDLNTSSYLKRRQLGQLEAQNTDLRNQMQKVTAQMDRLQEELQIMTARYESVRPPQSRDQAPPTPQLQHAPYMPYASVASGGARPKTLPTPPPCNEANRGKSPYVPRFQPAPGPGPRETRSPQPLHRQDNRPNPSQGGGNNNHNRRQGGRPSLSQGGRPNHNHRQGGRLNPRQADRHSPRHVAPSRPAVPTHGHKRTGPPAKPATPATPSSTQHGGSPTKPKTKMTVIGASNVQHLAPQLQTDDIDTVAYVHSGQPLHKLAARVPDMVTRDTDIVALHLGTIDALSLNDEQCMSWAEDALYTIERDHRISRRDAPILVCAVPPTRIVEAQERVDMLNALYEQRCARSRHLHFVDTGLTIDHIRYDGVHLTAGGRSKLASAITAAAQDFRKVLPLRVV